MNSSQAQFCLVLVHEVGFRTEPAAGKDGRDGHSHLPAFRNTFPFPQEDVLSLTILQDVDPRS